MTNDEQTKAVYLTQRELVVALASLMYADASGALNDDAQDALQSASSKIMLARLEVPNDETPKAGTEADGTGGDDYRPAGADNGDPERGAGKRGGG